MEEKFVKKNDLLEALGIKYAFFRMLRGEGAPGPSGKGTSALWPLYAWCEFLVNRIDKGPKSMALTARAATILRKRDGVQLVERISEVSFDENTGEGLESALERLRQAERATYVRWQELFKAEEPGAPQAFKDWQQALDLLRKSEKSLTEYLVQRRDLLPADEVKTWMVTMLTTARQTMLNMPGKLAPQLENKEWPYIQKRLEEEVRFVLEKVSSQPR